MNFNQRLFVIEVREEMSWLGVNSEELAKACYIKHGRMKDLLMGRYRMKKHEVQIIKKKLNIT